MENKDFISFIGQTGINVAMYDKEIKCKENYEWCKELDELRECGNKISCLERVKKRILEDSLKKEKKNYEKNIDDFQEWIQNMSIYLPDDDIKVIEKYHMNIKSLGKNLLNKK